MTWTCNEEAQTRLAQMIALAQADAAASWEIARATFTPWWDFRTIDEALAHCPGTLRSDFELGLNTGVWSRRLKL